MVTRQTYPGRASDGDIYTAGNHARMPGGWLAYLIKTTSEPDLMTANSTPVAIPGLSAVIGTPSGSTRLIKVTAVATLYTTTADTNYWLELHIYRDGAVRNTALFYGNDTVERMTLTATWVEALAGGGSYTYEVYAEKVNLTDNAGVTAVNNHALLIVEDLGEA